MEIRVCLTIFGAESSVTLIAIQKYKEYNTQNFFEFACCCIPRMGVERGLSSTETREQAQEFGEYGAEEDIGPRRN
jgi:hypothetical protein